MPFGSVIVDLFSQPEGGHAPLTDPVHRRSRAAHSSIEWRRSRQRQARDILVAFAREAREPKTHLVAHISEELRTPMTSVRSYADIWLAEVVGILGKAQREYMQKIQSNVERVEEMLADLTEIAAVDTGKAKIQARPLAESPTSTEAPQEDTE